MEKDPAFLFYPKDWLQGTSKLMPAEKGVYIDLLAHQHQDGAIPNDTKRLARMVGLSQPEFLEIWEVLKDKFVPGYFNHLVNQKLTKVTTERAAKSRGKKITGTFASVVRLSPYSYEIKEQVKKLFNINQFLDTTDEFLNQAITSWFEVRAKSIAIGNANEIGNKDRGAGERIWNSNPGEPEMSLELPPVKKGAVVELFGISKNHKLTDTEVDGLWNVFKKQNFTGNKYYQSKNEVYSHFINWSKTQTINGNGTHKQSPPANGTRVTKSSGAEKLTGKFKDKLSTYTGGEEGS